MTLKELHDENILQEIKDKTDKELLEDCILHLAYGLDDMPTFIRQEFAELLCRFNLEVLHDNEY